MMNTNERKYPILLLLLHATMLNAVLENSKFLGTPDDPEDRRLGNRRRPSSNQGSNPCNFGGGYRNDKTQGTGRTFFDLQFLNVEHNYNLDINCGGNGGHYPAPVTEIHHGDHGGGQHRPPLGGLGGGHRPPRPPHPPMHGGHRPPRPPRPGGGGFFQNLFGGGGGGGGGGNKPHSSESESSYQADTGPFGGFFPSPQQFATGLSEGLQGFIGTLPDIGQSIQSILPSFDNFQWPQLPNFELPNFQRPQSAQPNPGGNGPSQFGPVFPAGGSVPANNFNRPPNNFGSVISTTPAFVTPSTLTTTIDPDDVVYTDEIKPVHEPNDPITDPYSNTPSDNLPPGQYLSISNPHLGSFTQDLSIFNPTNIHKTWTQGVQEVLEELGSYF